MVDPFDGGTLKKNEMWSNLLSFGGRCPPGGRSYSSLSDSPGYWDAFSSRTSGFSDKNTSKGTI